MMETADFLGLVNEENSGVRQSGEGVGHLADSGIVDEPSEEEQDAWRSKNGTNMRLTALSGTKVTQTHNTTVLIGYLC